MIATRHDYCTTCDWLGREAQRTAQSLGRDSWISETHTGPDHNQTLHRAEYTTQEETP